MTEQHTSAVRLVVYLDTATYNELLKLAQTADRSRSWIIRKLINDSKIKQEQPQ